jgi:hypothetical protein
VAALSCLALLLWLPTARAGAQVQDTFPAAERIVAVGDVHGDFDRFVALLRQAEVIDGRNRWSGGRTHLVQTGDVPDRGPDTRKVMDLLMELEKQAARAGGRVHALIGNHEAMNVIGDLRYVVPGEYAAFRTRDSEALRARAYRLLADSARRDDPEYRRQWEAERPLGWVEHRLAWEGEGSYGDWVRGHNAVVRIGPYLFLHGGIGPAYVDRSLAALNEAVRRDLTRGAPPGPDRGITEDPEGPLWYRGLATGDETALAAHVDSVLAAYGVRHVVIGHTVTPGAILPRFGGKVIMIDVGLAAYYGGPPAALVVEDGRPYALHRGTRLPLPLDGDVLPYLQAAAALEPERSRLRKYVDQLAGATVPGGH